MNYQKIYNQLIEKRRLNPISRKDCYCQYHHIKPRSIYPELIQQFTNIIALTAREHFIAHRLLVYIYKNKYGQYSLQYKSMVYALWMMSHLDKFIQYKVTNRVYEQIKIDVSKIHSNNMSGKNNPMYGKNAQDFMTQQAIIKKRLLQKTHAQGKYVVQNLKKDPEKYNAWCKKISQSRIGQKLNEEQKKLRGINNIGKHWWNNGIQQVFQFQCPIGYVKGRLYKPNLETKKLVSNILKKTQKEKINKIKLQQPDKFNQWHKKAKTTLKNKHYHWYTNGINNILAISCPIGYTLGRIKK